jgi:hypothetical protein
MLLYSIVFELFPRILLILEIGKLVIINLNTQLLFKSPSYSIKRGNIISEKSDIKKTHSEITDFCLL